MTVASISQALSAYGAALQRAQPAPPAGGGTVSGFASLRASEAKAVEALSGKANLQDVVEAVTEAELSLQKMTAVRDRVISAYQEIMRMPI